MKKLMILGGSKYIIPVIEAAHKLGLYVITCDYLPDNDAHKVSDEYCNISIVEQEKVLAYAKEKCIDGILTFACDAGAVTASYVAEEMNLPFQCSYESTKILQDKGLFRAFLTNNGFNCPKAKRYMEAKEALNDIDFFNWPVIVKPVDAAGSKGVTRVDNPANLESAIAVAKLSSRNGAFIIEDFLVFDGFHSSTDPFSINGSLEFVTYSDQLFDEEASNPYTPALIIWPSTMKNDHQKELSKELQRLMNLLKMKTGIYNIETCVSKGKPYIMEVSPRGGGCRIAELQKMAYGVDLIDLEVRKAVGLPLDPIPQNKCDGYWCELVVHSKSNKGGILKEIYIDKEIEEKYVRLIDFSVQKGDYVEPFTGGNMSLGDVIFQFSSREELNRIIEKQDEWLHIELEK